MGVPWRLHPRNGTALRRTSVTSAASRSRSSALRPVAERVAQLGLAGQRQRPGRRLRERHVGGRGRELRGGAPPVADEVVPQPVHERRLAERSDGRELVGHGLQHGLVAGQARQERALEQDDDPEVVRQRREVERGLERALGRAHGARPSAPCRAARIRSQNLVQRSAG